MVEILWQQYGLFQDVLQDPARIIAEREKKKKQGMIIPFGREEKMC